jgi:putative ABC transport system permease protein
MNYMRVLFTDREKISLARPGVFVAAVDQFEDIVKTELPQVKTLSGMRASTNRMETKMLFLRFPVLLLAAFVVAVVGYYLFLVSGLIARKREHEIAMFRSRGLSIFQIFRLQIIEGVVVIVLPALVAPLFAALGIGLAGKLPVFKSLTDGSHLPVELSLSVWVWSGITALLVFLILLTQVLVVARSGISTVDRSRARPDRPPIFQRFYLDILIIILGGFFVWEISTRGIATAQRDGGIATDITLLFAPVMLLISTALLILRLFPVVAGVSYSIATRFTSASLAIGFWRLGRDPYWYSWPILLLILGTGLGVMVGTLGSTLERSAREQIYYDNGTSLRILPGGMSTKVDSEDMSDLGWLCQT